MAYGPGLANAVVQKPLKKARYQSRADYDLAASGITQGYGKARDLWQPWSDYGQNALSRFQTWESSPSNITSDPSYQWRLNQGLESVENSAAARGGALSGNALRAITDYGQNAASQEYQNEYNRWLSRLGLGQSGVSNMSNLYTDEANRLAQIRMGQGNNWFNQALASAQEIRAAENDLNKLIQSWVPAQYGGGGSSSGQASGNSLNLDSSYQGTADSFGSWYGG
jgi:hypothetical protein